MAEDPEQRLAVLQRENERLREILELLPEGITARCPDKGRIYLNPEGGRRIGMAGGIETRDSFLAQAWDCFEVWTEAGAPAAFGDLPSAHVAMGQEAAEAILRARHRQTGEEYWWRIRSRGSRGPDGALRQVVTIWYDVTAARRAEEGLRLLADAGRILSDTLDLRATLSSLARLLVPALGDECIIYLYGDDGLLRRAEIVARDPAREALVRALDRFPIPAGPEWPLGRMLATGRTLVSNDVADRERQAWAQNAEYLEVLRRIGVTASLFTPLVARGTLVGAIGMGMTTSGRRYAKEDVALAEDLGRRAAVAIENARLYERAQQAIRVRDEFLQVAAHELKTPITSLRGFAQLMLHRLDSSVRVEEADLRRAIGTIDRQSHRLARLVAQLLDASRIEAGKLQLEPRMEDLVALCRRVLGAYPDAAIALRAPEALPLFCDPLRLEQVITNLLDNAIKFSPPGAPIDLAIALDPSAPLLARLSVTDQGPGIPPAHRERIFERFYQIHAGHHISGMGLGLFISREIVGQHGGTLRAEFPEAGGSRFVVRLPLTAPSAGDAPP